MCRSAQGASAISWSQWWEWMFTSKCREFGRKQVWLTLPQRWYVSHMLYYAMLCYTIRYYTIHYINYITLHYITLHPMHACMHACICIYIHIHACMHTDRQTDRQTDRHIHTYIHTYVRTTFSVFWPSNFLGQWFGGIQGGKSERSLRRAWEDDHLLDLGGFPKVSDTSICFNSRPSCSS